MSHSPTWIKEMLAHLKSKGPLKLLIFSPNNLIIKLIIKY